MRYTLFTWFRIAFLVTALLGVALCFCSAFAQAEEKNTPPKAKPGPPILIRQGPLEQINQYYSTQTITYSDGTSIVKSIINGPPTPPPGTGLERSTVDLPEPNAKRVANSLTVPAFNWVFGCSSVSGAMIAGYYDRNGFPDMYTGPTDGGVMPLNNSSWPTWSDGYTTYPNLPLAASHNGVDGRTTRGSIDDYWVQYDSSAQDPYITNGWTQHTWGSAIGDYMKTSQSAYGNTDGATRFYNWAGSADRLTCGEMVINNIHNEDGTYGRKLFYEARGYTVTTCYNQKTDNNITGGFSFADYKTEIDAGRPVMLNLAGHTIVGVGYDDTGNTVYIHDTWDYSNHTLIWDATPSYSGMTLQSVSIANLQPAASECPDCSGSNVDLDGDTFPTGETCTCEGTTISLQNVTIPDGATANISGSTSITVDSGTTFENGSTATLTSPVTTFNEGSTVESGATLNVGQ